VPVAGGWTRGPTPPYGVATGGGGGTGVDITGVAVGGRGVKVGTEVRVGRCPGMFVGVGVAVGVLVGVGVSVAVLVGVGVLVEVAVLVGVGVLVEVAVLVGAGVLVDVGSPPAVQCTSTPLVSPNNQFTVPSKRPMSPTIMFP